MLLRFHAVFALAAAIVLGPAFLTTPAYSKTSATGIIVCAHTFTFPLLAGVDSELYRMWRFSILCSLFQVLPDWFLVRILHTLKFSDCVWMIGGDVPFYMAGMWAIPLVWILASVPAKLAMPVQQLLAATISLVTFGTAEWALASPESPLQLWSANVRQHVLGSVAVYVLPAEAALGAATLAGYRATSATTGWEGFVAQTLAAASVAVFYTGALCLSYMFLEHAHM
jgi:hypothetical protein